MIFNPHFDHLSYEGSASAIRPAKMKKAFEDCGLTVISVEGPFSVRQEASKDLIKKLDGGYRPAFLYCESSTSPHVLDPETHLPKHSFELDLARKCCELKVPTALFYRDVYWNTVKEERLRDRLIQLYYKPFFKREWMDYSTIYDKIYLPSIQMKGSLPTVVDNVGVLMPGGDISSVDIVYDNVFRGVYVGGISGEEGLYNMSPVMRACRAAEVPLDLICRVAEWVKHEDFYSSLRDEYLNVVHEVGDAMKLKVQQASVGFLFFPEQFYRSFAFPFKVMEYLFSGLPIIANMGTPVAKFLDENNIGWAISSENELTELLDQLKNDPAALRVKRERIAEILPLNTWKARAQQVINEMVSK